METIKLKFMKNSCSIRDNYMFLYKHELPLIEHEFLINFYKIILCIYLSLKIKDIQNLYFFTSF